MFPYVSAITTLQIDIEVLNGIMKYLLNSLMSLKTLNFTSNIIYDSTPYQLPPNLMRINLAYNKINVNLPYSISHMADLSYF
ncbi:unnamed protein product [Coffea canephora]|uniref:Uncharacterized protein n=1 Tax=Coffea canephora TaxID=49390 RepID=A0A068V5P3_COFCA|nr:unnamed protein product [Coffea canephora]